MATRPLVTRPVATRRQFLAAAAASALAALPLAAQDVPGASMEGDGYRPVRLPPKPGAKPSMAPDARDAVERRLSCPCPCTLDVFVCRTSMPCGFSPRMHADVASLVAGGYTGDEIVEAFVNVYGERVLMAPTKQGFNWVGWLAPFAAIGGGAVVLAALVRRWQSPARPLPAPAAMTDATDEELRRVEAAVRNEDGR